MASADRLAALAAELRSALPVLDCIDRFHDEFQHRPHASRRSIENAIIVSDVMVSFYTCARKA